MGLSVSFFLYLFLLCLILPSLSHAFVTSSTPSSPSPSPSFFFPSSSSSSSSSKRRVRKNSNCFSSSSSSSSPSSSSSSSSLLSSSFTDTMRLLSKIEVEKERKIEIDEDIEMEKDRDQQIEMKMEREKDKKVNMKIDRDMEIERAILSAIGEITRIPVYYIVSPEMDIVAKFTNKGKERDRDKDVDVSLSSSSSSSSAPSSLSSYETVQQLQNFLFDFLLSTSSSTLGKKATDIFRRNSSFPTIKEKDNDRDRDRENENFLPFSRVKYFDNKEEFASLLFSSKEIDIEQQQAEQEEKKSFYNVIQIGAKWCESCQESSLPFTSLSYIFNPNLLRFYSFDIDSFSSFKRAKERTILTTATITAIKRTNKDKEPGIRKEIEAEKEKEEEQEEEDSNNNTCEKCSYTGFILCRTCNGKGHIIKKVVKKVSKKKKKNKVSADSKREEEEEEEEYTSADICPSCVGMKKIRCPHCGGKCLIC